MPSRGWIFPGEQPDDYSGRRVERIDLATGAVTVLYTQCGEHMLRGPKRHRLQRSRRVLVPRPRETRSRDRDLDRGRLYYATPGSYSITAVLMPLGSANGIALSHYGRKIYVVSGGVNPLLFGGEGAVLHHAGSERRFDVMKCSWPREGPAVGWVGALRPGSER